MLHKKEVIVLSIFFFIIMTASTSYDGIVAYMFEELKMPDVGPTSLAVLFISFAVSLVLAPAIKLPIKTQFLIAAAAFPINYLLGLYASLCECKDTIYWLVSIGTAIGGIGNGILWVSQGRYIHLVLQIFDEAKDRGKMFALFGLFYSVANLAGSVITLVGLGFFSVTAYFGVLVFVDILAIFYGYFYLRDIQPIAEEELERLRGSNQEGKDEKIEKVQEIIDKEAFRKNEGEYDIPDFLKKFFSFIPCMLCLFPLFIIQAFEITVSVNILYKIIPESTEGSLKTKYNGLIQIIGGIASIIGMAVFGFIFDLLGTIVSSILIIVVYLLLCWLLILALQIENLFMAFLLAFLWTFMLRYNFGLIPTIVSKHYDGRVEGFSVIKLIPAIFNALFQVLLIITKNQMSPQMLAGFSLLFIPAIIGIMKVTTAYKPEEAHSHHELKEEEEIIEKQ